MSAILHDLSTKIEPTIAAIIRNVNVADAALLEAESYEPERVGARLLGRDIGSVLRASTRAQIIDILEEQSAPGSNAYPLVDQMLGGLIPIDRTESEVEKQIELLRCLRRGMDEAILPSP